MVARTFGDKKRIGTYEIDRLICNGNALFRGPSPWVDPTHPKYRAKGDGVANDTAAIQAAIDDALTGSVIYLPPGTYTITDTLVIAKSLTFQGAGPSTIIKYADGATIGINKPLISVKPSGASFADVVIARLTIDGNRANATQTGTWNAGIEVSTNEPYNVGNVWISKVHVKGTVGDCISVRGATGYTVIPYDVFIIANLFEDWHDDRQGVAIIDGRRVTISKNHFFNYSGTNWAVDIEPNNNAGEVADTIEISGNILDVPRGITVADQDAVTDGGVLIYGNIDNTTTSYASIPNLAKVATFKISSGIQEAFDYFGVANTTEMAASYSAHARLDIKAVRTTVNLSGASVTFEPAAAGILAGGMILGVQFNVETLITGCTSWSAAFSRGSTTSLGTGLALAVDTKVNQLIVPEILTDYAEITVTAVGGAASFSAGTLEVITYYMFLQPMGDV